MKKTDKQLKIIVESGDNLYISSWVRRKMLARIKQVRAKKKKDSSKNEEIVKVQINRF